MNEDAGEMKWRAEEAADAAKAAGAATSIADGAGAAAAAATVATATGAPSRRRAQSIREPLAPGTYVEYSVDDQPGVVERARAFLAGAPGEPVAPRMAATVMLVSEGKPHYRRFESPLAGGDPIEETVEAAPVDVFMLRRASTMAFTPDAVVFPGGGMDARDVECAVPWAGPAPAQWAALMSCPESVARGVITAAAREVFEESGVLLASAPDGTPVVDERGDHWAAEREAVAARQVSFGEFLRERGLVLRSDLLRLRSHWVTPESEARRYDTYFFLARLPKGQHADGRTSEAVEAAWIAPGEALARFDAGLLKLVPPTISNLTSIVAATSVDEAWNAPFDGHVRPHPVARPCGEVVLGCEVSET